ncbi:MAG TPA: hypothetical protein VGD77_00900 [Gemmatimonadaceae bacterium]
MKFTTTLRLAALFGVVASAGTAQAQANCNATSTGPITFATGAPTPTAANPACDVGDAMTATVQHVLRLEIASNTTNLGTIGQVQFDSTANAANMNAWPFTLGPEISAKGNRAFKVYVRSTGANWGWTGGGTYNVGATLTANPNKPIGDFVYAVADSGVTGALASGYAALTQTDAEILSQAPKGGRLVKQMHYRTAWKYENDIPGNYALTVVYTIVGQ